MQYQAPFDDLWSDTLLRVRELVYHQGWWWVGTALVAYALCFLILPTDRQLSQMKNQVQQDRQEILGLVKKSEQLMMTRDLAIGQDPFYMERSIRETFRVKRIHPNGIQND
jgi:hypothetical protein